MILINIFFLMLFTSGFSQEIKLEFIAMQYHSGILNRSYVVQVSDSLIFGGKVQGAIAAGVSLRYTHSQLEDPYFFTDQNRLSFYHKDNLIHLSNLDLDKSNLLFKISEVENYSYTSRKKWGLGDVISSGRIFFNLKQGKKVEFILLGKPDVETLLNKLDLILKRVERTK